MRERVVVETSIGIMVVVPDIGIIVVEPVIGMPLTTVPPPVVTTPLPLLADSLGFTVVPGMGIGVGTAVPGVVVGATVGVAGVMTVPGLAITGVLYTEPDIRLRSRLRSPKRRVGEVPVALITIGAVGASTLPDGTGAGVVVVAGGSAARAFTANRQATATANINRFTMLPPETCSLLTPGRPFSHGRSSVHSLATERTSGNHLVSGSRAPAAAAVP